MSNVYLCRKTNEIKRNVSFSYKRNRSEVEGDNVEKVSIGGVLYDVAAHCVLSKEEM